MRYDLFDVLWSCNPKRRTCSYVHSPLLFLSKMLIVLVSSPCILKFFLQQWQKSFLLIFFFFQRAELPTFKKTWSEILSGVCHTA